jgi:hypothetical protein
MHDLYQKVLELHADDAADRFLEKQMTEFLILDSIINGTRRLRKTKAQKIAREILAGLKEQAR